MTENINRKSAQYNDWYKSNNLKPLIPFKNLITTY